MGYTVEQPDGYLSPINVCKTGNSNRLQSSSDVRQGILKKNKPGLLQGFVGLNISDNVTRFVTMAPAMLIIILGINPMFALVMSQVVLSFVLPMAIIPMLLITGRKNLMDGLVNKRVTNVLGWVITGIIICLNCVLLAMTFAGMV